jgi:Cu2+-exporting ATPase
MTDFMGTSTGCCAPVVEEPADAAEAVRRRVGPLEPYISRDEAGADVLNLMVEGITCGGCISKIEGSLGRVEGVRDSRVNLSTGRLRIRFARAEIRPELLIARLDQLGYRAVPYDPAALKSERDQEERRLLRAMAVAGFASANVMLLSVSVWAGHFQDMGPGTRTLLHWISGMIAVPAVLYAGRPFFDSALAALRGGRTNMDVPISLAVMLATGMSVMETLRGADHAYFDSAVMLLFFLLIGRYLDRRARGRARSAAEQLTGLSAVAVTVVEEDGTLSACAPSAVQPGMTVLVPAGGRIPVDGTVTHGRSDVDSQLITGESVPEAVGPGSHVYAGAVNTGAPLKLSVRAAGEGTLLAEIARLMEAAEQRRARYVGIADAVSRWYAPVVHLLALGTFLGWFFGMGLGWQDSLLIAIAVLIITCPCALGLAVPVVQVIACSRLMRGGTLLKSGSALERLAQIDTVVFDKTGTLTQGRPALVHDAALDEDALRRAAALAAASSHPLSRALTAAAGPGVAPLDGVREIPGRGLEWDGRDGTHRLGSRAFVGLPEEGTACESRGPELCYARPGAAPAVFRFTDAPRRDAAAVVDAFHRAGIEVHLLSGDREAAVAETAEKLGIETWQARITPDGKLHYLEELRSAGRKPAMVGDGLNDAPALAAALVSLSPASGADISRTAADIVFQGAELSPVWEAYRTARRAEALVRQNFVMAFGYNIFTIPLAVAGFVTPLIAAVAMSSSSLIVIGNALRLGWTKPARVTKLKGPDADTAASDRGIAGTESAR